MTIEEIGVFHPWRRFLARTFDLFMYNILWSAFLAFAFHVNLSSRGNWGTLLDCFIAIAIMLGLEPVWLHFSGTTPGKAIFGLRIKTPEGRHLSLGEDLTRTWRVIGTGMGYNIPFYNLFRLWKSYRLCSENEIQPWDDAIAYTLKDKKWYRGVLYVGVYAAAAAVLVTIMSAQKLPPNRGELTVAEFVENHNYYAGFLGINFGNEYLSDKGKWEKRDFNGTAYIEIGHAEKPEYHFTIEDGHVTGVSFAVEIRNNKDWLNSYDSEMLLASLAFAGAQDEMGLFSKTPERIAEQTGNNTFKDFHFTEAGISFTCDTEYSGYIDTQSHFLVPEENAAETYFSLNFTMNK